MNEVIKKILQTAVWAPSGDNSQPWRFEVSGSVIEVFCIPEKDNPIFNFHNRGTYIATGALIENLVIAAAHEGYRADVVLVKSENINHIASVTLKEDKSISDNLFESIRKRSSNRKFYKKNKPLSEEQKEVLIKANNLFGVSKLSFIEDKQSMNIVGQAVSKNEVVMLENKKLHDFFYSDIRWTTKSERRLKTGLYLKTMELALPQLVVFKALQFWPVAKILNSLGTARFIAGQNAKLYGNGSALGIMTLQDNDADFVGIGRALQRIWLEVTRMGLSMHLVSGVIFLAQLVNARQAGEFSAEHIEIIDKAYKEILSVLPEKPGAIGMIFRIGYANNPSGTQSRLEPVITFK